jgi:predicted RND superfamily exporter protein
VREAILARLAGVCARRAGWAALLALALAAGSVWPASARLGVTSDTSVLFSADLSWRQQGLTLQRAFPQNDDLLVAVD